MFVSKTNKVCEIMFLRVAFINMGLKTHLMIHTLLSMFIMFACYSKRLQAMQMILGLSCSGPIHT